MGSRGERQEPRIKRRDENFRNKNQSLSRVSGSQEKQTPIKLLVFRKVKRMQETSPCHVSPNSCAGDTSD